MCVREKDMLYDKGNQSHLLLAENREQARDERGKEKKRQRKRESENR